MGRSERDYEPYNKYLYAVIVIFALVSISIQNPAGIGQAIEKTQYQMPATGFAVAQYSVPTAAQQIADSAIANLSILFTMLIIAGAVFFAYEKATRNEQK